MKHHTKAKGDLAVAKVVADLTEKGFDILLPLSEHLPFDLVAHKENNLYKIQVKFSSIKNGCITAHLYSTWADRNGSHRTYIDKSKVDFFAIYCGENNTCYYFNPSKFENTTQVILRLEPSKISGNLNIKFAKDFINIP